jgi:hypothetical protein
MTDPIQKPALTVGKAKAARLLDLAGELRDCIDLFPPDEREVLKDLCEMVIARARELAAKGR